MRNRRNASMPAPALAAAASYRTREINQRQGTRSGGSDSAAHATGDTPMFMSAISVAEATPVKLTFDMALARYEALARADDLDAKSRRMAAACEAYERDNTQLIVKYGHRSAMPPAAKECWEASWARLKAAEREHEEMFSEPRWQAACDLFALPAPTLGAVVQKLAVAKEEDITVGDLIAFVEADLRRLEAVRNVRGQ